MANLKKRAPSDLYTQLQPRLSALLPPHARVTLGLSGGVDSVVLLDLLLRAQTQFAFTLTAVHINHHINPQADSWQSFCADLCAARGVAFIARAVYLPAQIDAGIEGEARALRYRALSEVASDVLFLAHHLDDQAETLFLNLLRGSGVAGAAAMPPQGGMLSHIARPLLDVPREKLLAYAQAQALCWIEDDSNHDVSYGRNFLRHQIFPLIETRFPAYRQTLSRAAGHFAEADLLLLELARQDAGHAVHADKLNCRALAALSFARAKNLLRFYLAQQGVPPISQERLEENLRQILSAQQDAQIQLGHGALVLRRYRGQVWVVAALPTLDTNWRALWQGQMQWALPALGGSLHWLPAEGVGLSRAKMQAGEISVRLRQGGEKLKPDCHRPRRGLKQLLQEAAIPPWQRLRLPLIYCGEDLIAAPGLGIDCAYQAQPGESSLQFEWLCLH